MSDKSTEERLREVEAENEAIKDFLAKYVKKGPSRRTVLKSGATAAGAGMLGFGAGSATAAPSTSDSDGNVGGPNNRIDVFADGTDANSSKIGELYTPSSDWDYLLFEDSGTFKAVDATGLISSGSDFSTVAQAMYDAIPTSGKYEYTQCAINVENTAQVTGAIVPADETHTKLNGRFQIQDGSAADFITDGGTASNRIQLDGYGAAIYGSGATNPGTGIKLKNTQRGYVHGFDIEEMHTGISTGQEIRYGDMRIAACSNKGIQVSGADCQFYNIGIGAAGTTAVDINNGGCWFESISTWNSGGRGFVNQNGPETWYIGCHADNHDSTGFMTDQDDQYYVGCTARNNGQDSGVAKESRSGFRTYSTEALYMGCTAFDDQATATQQYGYANNGDYTRWVGNRAYGNSAAAWQNALSTNSVSAANIPTLA